MKSCPPKRLGNGDEYLGNGQQRLRTGESRLGSVRRTPKRLGNALKRNSKRLGNGFRVSEGGREWPEASNFIGRANLSGLSAVLAQWRSRASWKRGSYPQNRLGNGFVAKNRLGNRKNRLGNGNRVAKKIAWLPPGRPQVRKVDRCQGSGEARGVDLGLFPRRFGPISKTILGILTAV